MEGPTPVSALVHSATMVAAGVYLVGRFYPVFTPEVLLVIAIVGCITLFLAATIAITATDIKRVLAYSTVSQLGYMMLALGVGGWLAGLFHLITHAFFKSLLFLCSGSVIHACHTNDMPKMGGLRKKMPWTAYTMLVGCLAIAGGGHSVRDRAERLLLERLDHRPSAVVLERQRQSLVRRRSSTSRPAARRSPRSTCSACGIMTFAGTAARSITSIEHAHESPRVMSVPLVILAVFAVVHRLARCWAWPNLLEQARPAGALATSTGGIFCPG